MIVVDQPRCLVGCRVPAGLELAHLQNLELAEPLPELA